MRARILAAFCRFRAAVVVGAFAAAVVLYLITPALFWVAVVIGLVTCLLVVIDQRDDAAAGWADELFVAAGLRHKAKLLTAVNVQLVEDYHRCRADFEAVTARLAEVLREHAECPIPLARPDGLDDAWLELLVTRPEGDAS